MSEGKKAQDGGLREIIVVVLQAFVIALVFRSFAYQTFHIPSSSMKDTLLVGDLLFVSKFSYGYSRYSFPFAIIPFEGRIFGSDPERGDVVVFRVPQDQDKDYIKRLVGLPGDKVEMINGHLHINNEPVKRERVEDFVDNTPYGDTVIQRFVETLPNGVTHSTLDERQNENVFGRNMDNTGVFEIPANHFFMMGDNRDNSNDSRGIVEFVHEDQLVGRADRLFLSVEEGNAIWAFWKWPWTMRWSRIFSAIQ